MKLKTIVKSLFKTPAHGLPDIEVSTPMPEVKPCKGYNISEPVLTFVEKVKDDPSRIKFTKEDDLTSTYFYFEDKLTTLKGKYLTPILYKYPMKTGCYILLTFLLTKDEKDYILKELEPVLKEFNKGRKRKNIMKILITILGVLLLSGCEPSPMDKAKQDQACQDKGGGYGTLYQYNSNKVFTEHSPKKETLNKLYSLECELFKGAYYLYEN